MTNVGLEMQANGQCETQDEAPPSFLLTQLLPWIMDCQECTLR